MPFQYPLHRIDAEGKEPKHFEYLVHPGPDPRKGIAEKLLGEIPFGACVLVYNRAFEKRVLRELGESLPGLRERLNAVAEGMIDLMEPFRRRDIYHWRMVGEISDPAELARLRKALLEYCRQDTLGIDLLSVMSKITHDIE